MKSPKRSSGFSLVEMLVVLAIIAVMAALVVPATTSMMSTSNLTTAGDQVSSMLALARQHAMARNRSVQVRWYQFADPSFSGETAGSPATGHYRAMQAFEADETGTATWVALTKMQRLPTGVIIDRGGISSLLSTSFVQPPLTTPVIIPLAGTAYNFCAFRFFPDGSTDIAQINPTGPWYLALHNLNVAGTDNLATPPKNYVTLTIDPTDGIPVIYRP
jgi:uncharacterized protein (TIGR02596 family)